MFKIIKWDKCVILILKNWIKSTPKIKQNLLIEHNVRIHSQMLSHRSVKSQKCVCVMLKELLNDEVGNENYINMSLTNFDHVSDWVSASFN